MAGKRVIKLSDISRKDFSVDMGKLSVKTSSAIARSNDGSGNLVLFNPSDPLAGWVMPANIKDKGTIFVQFSNGIAAFEYISNVWYFRFFQPNAANTVIVSEDADNSITEGSDGGAYLNVGDLGEGAPVISSITGTLPSGKTIATHNNGIGGSTIIRETVTNLVVSGQDGTYTNENGVTSTFKQAIQYNTGEVRNGSVGDPALVIQNGAVVEAKIADSAVTTNKVNNLAVTNAKLATAPAHTIKTNNTGSAASPTDLVINENKLVGRPVGGSVSNISISTDLEIPGGTLGLTDTGVVAGEYINPTITVDDKGRVTEITGTCPIRLEAFNYIYGQHIYPIITGAGELTNPANIAFSPNSFVFQRLGGVAPAFTWTDVQTGVDVGSGILKYISATEDYYRIKYTHTNGCIYYSNIINVFFP